MSRVTRAVSNSREYDTAEVYLYDGQKIIETRDGSNYVKKQFVHGTQYIDELLMVRVYNKGDFYVHQDANWNVIGVTDLRGSTGGKVAERYVYTPYGEVNVMQETSFGDRDGDEDVDSTDKGTVGVTCTGTVTGECRILDLDFDGDYDSTDATLFDSLPSGIARHPGKFASGLDQPFMHQGLLLEPELRQYQNRARQYDPNKKRFMQRNPIGNRIRVRRVYKDGMHLAEYLGSAPLSFIDPLGTKFSLSGFFQSWITTIVQLSIFVAETVIGILDNQGLEGGINYGNYCGPNRACFGFNNGEFGDFCFSSGGPNGCQSFTQGCTRRNCPSPIGGTAGLDECCRIHDGCYCDGTDNDRECVNYVQQGPSEVSPSDCHDYFQPTERTSRCDEELCDCMDNRNLSPGSAAWNQREQMRVVFRCFYE